MSDDELCEYCGENPKEPGMPCCANSVCVGRYIEERDS